MPPNMSIVTSELAMTRALNAVHAVGTPSLRCMALLRSLPKGFDHGGRTLHLDVQEMPDDDFWDLRTNEEAALLLVLVDAPARALVGGKSAHSSADPEAGLAQWRAVAARALHFAHRHPESCVLVDVAAQPHGLAGLFEELGLSRGEEADDLEGPAEDGADPVELVIAECLASLDPSSTVLYEEIRVSCRWPLAVPLARTEGADAAKALQAYRDLVAKCEELVSRAAQVRSLVNEQDLLLSQVQQLEEIASSLHAKLKAAENTGASLRARVAGMETAGASLRSTVAEMTERLKAAQVASAAQFQLLMRERQAASEESRRLRAEVLDCERARQLGAGAAWPRVRAEAVQPGASVEAGDHRHLDFTLGSLVVGHRTVSGLRFRLLDHLGRPGLAIFAAPDGSTALGQWETDGEEGGASFMLMLPSETRGATLLRRMGTTDWQVVRTLARAVALELSRQHGDLAPRWRTTAARLNCQLDALPTRIRYDAVSARVASLASPAAIDISFVHMLCGERAIAEVCVRWWPSENAGRARLAALAPAEGAEPLLASWPPDPEGLLQTEYMLPVGECWSPAAWLALPQQDRELVLAVLDSLTGSALQLPPEAMLNGWTSEKLGSAARHLNVAIRRSEKGLRLRRAVSRLWRRQTAGAA